MSTAEQVMQQAETYKLFKGIINNFEEDLVQHGYELDEQDKVRVINLVIDTTQKLFKGSTDEELIDFLGRYDRNIRATALNTLNNEYEQEALTKSMQELTYHPDHVYAHQVEESGKDVYPEMLKSRWNELPDELKNHMEQYHMENRLWHTHTDNLADPLIFGKSVETNMVERNYIHEIAHRLDEKAVRGEEADDEEISVYSELYKAEIYPGMVASDGVVITPELAEHMNGIHGPRYQAHPLELPMIGPSGSFVEFEHLKKSMPDRPTSFKTENEVSILKQELFNLGYETQKKNS